MPCGWLGSVMTGNSYWLCLSSIHLVHFSPFHFAVLSILFIFALQSNILLFFSKNSYNNSKSVSFMTFQDSVKTCFQKYATFNGRASRSEYWWFWLVCMVAGYIPYVGIVISLATLLPVIAAGYVVCTTPATADGGSLCPSSILCSWPRRGRNSSMSTEKFLWTEPISRCSKLFLH